MAIPKQRWKNLSEAIKKSFCEFFGEWLLLAPAPCSPCFRMRVSAWWNHVSTFNRIALAEKIKLGDPLPLGIIRINFIAGHLDILDRKFGSLLTFHSLMATIAAVYVVNFFQFQRHPVRDLSGSVVLIIFWVLWVFTTLICLSGLSRVKWGELKATVPLRLAEKKQVLSLIRSVIRRTARFRLAVLLTTVEIGLLLGSVWMAYSSVTPDAPTIHARIGPFTSGVGCSTLPNLDLGIAEAILKIQQSKATKIHIVGSADAMPMGGKLASEFGNNAGLALTRARCVAGWLAGAPGIKDMQVEMSLGIQDATDRSSKALMHGNSEDRFVYLSVPLDPQ